MKVAISTNESNLDALIETKFGRSPGFLIYDTVSAAMTFLENVQNAETSQSASTKAAEMLLNFNVESVISGHLGPKAYQVLDSAGIHIYNSASVPIKQALHQLSNGLLREQDA